VEDKEVILAVHHPGTSTRLARTRLAPAVTVARGHGLRVVDGRGWTEFRVPSCPDKGTAVAALVRRWRPRLLVVAGDDLGDVAMFETADRLRRHGHVERCVRLAVRGPGALAARGHGCDLVLDDPAACRAWLLGQALSATCGPGQR
jgi:trehalose 6-phosphate phosphatase